MLNFFINTAQAVSLPTLNQSNLPAFIASVYSFALTVVGLVVFIRILYAGFLWLTAAGNASKASDAKNKIQNAVIGAILLFAAYLILYIVNPDLVKNTFNFRIPQTNTISLTPAQVTLPTNTANIKGTPSSQTSFWDNIINPAKAAGIYPFTIKVADTNGDSCEKEYSIEILGTLGAKPWGRVFSIKPVLVSPVNAADDCSVVNLVTGTLPAGTEGVYYFAEIVAQGGASPYIYSISQGNLPPGLVLGPAADVGNIIGSGGGITGGGATGPISISLKANGGQSMDAQPYEGVTYRWSATNADSVSVTESFVDDPSFTDPRIGGMDPTVCSDPISLRSSSLIKSFAYLTGWNMPVSLSGAANNLADQWCMFGRIYTVTMKATQGSSGNSATSSVSIRTYIPKGVNPFLGNAQFQLYGSPYPINILPGQTANTYINGQRLISYPTSVSVTTPQGSGITATVGTPTYTTNNASNPNEFFSYPITIKIGATTPSDYYFVRFIAKASDGSTHITDISVYVRP